ncbi:MULTISPECIES: hypothetical protein [unclassified Ruminococcus]|uniref:hypothetical protein n=1 Tax=unclassified Ruminococcus TaxID=2608920 RepID=UPI00210B9F29|nr:MULTISPECIES: hypothetical protein [unclassified Ruminococcus]MCQ4021530.1 hypothetical protein [Ruminococcus sp. zg-924]MCQ4113975.1 hypothetical protein [Ruminococcus sp. zg-921]
MELKYEDVKILISKAITRCTKLEQCRITDAFPPSQSDNPVKRCICAIGLLSAGKDSRSINGVTVDTENTISAFVDIYTPVSKGGQFSSDCALELCAALEGFKDEYKVKVVVGDISYLSGCYAYKTRLKVTVSQSFENLYNDDTDSIFKLNFDGLPYVCRSVRFELSPMNTPIECYGECCPVNFVQDSKLCIARVKRNISDDGASLRHLKYPFVISGMSDEGLYLVDCAVVSYELDENLQEIVTISGRNEEYGA